MRIFALIVSATLLTACASLSRDECLTADWQTIGFEDGANGLPRQRIADHRKACASHGVTPDLSAYDAGHARGVAVYCTFARGEQSGRVGQLATPVCSGMTDYAEGRNRGLQSYCSFQTGLEEGINGRNYNHVCPSSLEAGFLAGYDQGSHIHALTTTREDIARELAQNEQAASKAEARIEEILKHVAQNDSLTRQQRTNLLQESEALRKELENLAEARTELRLKLDEIETKLNART